MTQNQLKNILVTDSNKLTNEVFDNLIHHASFDLEKIISDGQATAQGTWLEQDREEWVLLLQGSAAIKFENHQDLKILKVGDYLQIHAHQKHRVEWTSQTEKTIWLALHFKKKEKS